MRPATAPGSKPLIWAAHAARKRMNEENDTANLSATLRRARCGRGGRRKSVPSRSIGKRFPVYGPYGTGTKDRQTMARLDRIDVSDGQGAWTPLRSFAALMLLDSSRSMQIQFKGASGAIALRIHLVNGSRRRTGQRTKFWLWK